MAIDASVPRYFEKSELFDGRNFKRWQMKLRFYLTTLKMVDTIESDKLVATIANKPTVKEI